MANMLAMLMAQAAMSGYKMPKGKSHNEYCTKNGHHKRMYWDSKNEQWICPICDKERFEVLSNGKTK